MNFKFPTRPTIVALAVGALAACGSQTDARLSVEQTQTEEVLTRLYDAALGDPRARLSAEFRVNYLANAPIEECMDARGLDWHWSYAGLSVDSFALPSPWLAKPGARTVSQSAGASSRAAHFFQARDQRQYVYVKAQPPEYQNALHQCGDTAGESLPAIPSERGARQALATVLRSLIDVVDVGMKAEAADYRECMQSEGHPVPARDAEEGNPVVGHDAASSLVRNELPADLSQRPAPGEEATPAWAELVELERSVMAADIVCRGGAYARALDLATPLVAEAMRQHGELIERAEAAWNADIAWAEARGFDPAQAFFASGPVPSD